MPVNLNPTLAVAAGLPADTDFADDSVRRGWVQRRALFEVPAATTEELVQYAGDSYRRKFGAELERQGFRVMDMSKPVKVMNRIFGWDTMASPISPPLPVRKLITPAGIPASCMTRMN